MLTDAPVQFGLIPHDHWYQPDWIDEEKATAARNEMVRNQVIYGGASVSVPSQRLFLEWLGGKPIYVLHGLALSFGDTHDLIRRECAVSKHV